MKKTRGVIYIATGKKYIEEAIVSAASLKKHMPDLSVTLFTNEFVDSVFFDNIIKIDNPKFSVEDKVRYINKSPYNYTLYLDTDTYICDDVSELFDLLEKFDIAAKHANKRKKYFVKDVPDSFSELNFGIVIFKKSAEMKKFFSNLLKFYLRDKKKDLSDLYTPEFTSRKDKDFLKRKRRKGLPDQPSFREALYKSKLRIVNFSSEYNMTKKGFVNHKVKIIHGRDWDFGLIERIINSYSSPRVFSWSFGRLHVFFSKKFI